MATIVPGGTLWGMKNLTQDQGPPRMSVWLHEEVSSVAPFGDPDWHTEFNPERVAKLRSEVSGGFAAAHLVYDDIGADGITLPSRRRAYTRGADSLASLDPLLVSIDVSNVRFSWREGTTGEQNASLLSRFSGHAGRQSSEKSWHHRGKTGRGRVV